MITEMDVKGQIIRRMIQLDSSSVRKLYNGNDSGELSRMISKRKHKKSEREFLDIELIFVSFSTIATLPHRHIDTSEHIGTSCRIKAGI